MFDAHLQYFAYNNLDGDDFGVGYIGNKEDWIRRVNSWQANDGFDTRFTQEDFDDLDVYDLRGILLAEVEPVDTGWFVTWATEKGDNVAEISKDYQISWKINNLKSDTIPHWLKRLKNTLREQ